MSKLKFKEITGIYLFITGFLGHLVVVLAFFYLMHAEQLSARLLVKKAINKFNLEAPTIVENALQPKVNTNLPVDGMVNMKHPRILLPQLIDWNGVGVPTFIKERITEQKKNKSYFNSCGSDRFMFLIVCWLTTNDAQILQKLTRQMLGFELNKPTADTTYSNGWQLALAYDLLFSALNENQRNIIENKIAQALSATLANLDEEAASLWHGRSTHASIAWLCAIVLSERVNNVDVLQGRSQSHFINAIDALAYSAVWPGGYNYWIQNRAFLLALASSAYLNGLVGAEQAEKVEHVMQQVGYWMIYATRPDNTIEGFGDEGSRVDLKDETRRVIDLIVQMTHDPVLAGYSKYLDRLHGQESYYRGYRWGFLLFNDPSVWAMGDGTPKSLGNYLPATRLFGENTSNYAYFRSGWGQDDTFVSFKAGHSFTHHGHYDAGHFTIFKGAPLAINSSTYGSFFSENRLNYSIRTIAKNSILVLRPNEKVKPNRHFKENVSDGGQRLTLPTGSANLSVADWFENYQQKKHFEGAELLSYASKNGNYAFVSADLTPAYNNVNFDENNQGGKVSEVKRSLLYLPKEDQVIIFDQVIATNPEYTKKWLLHTVNRPLVEKLKVLRGGIDNGILESKSSTAVVKNKRGFLKITKILPENAVLRLVGGKDYQYYIESDGDDTVLDGKNYNQGAINKPWFDVGMWRIEIQPELPRKKDNFLIVLSPSLDEERTDLIKKIDVLAGDAVGVQTERSAIIFNLSLYQGEIEINLPLKTKELFLVGFPDSIPVYIDQRFQEPVEVISENGIVNFKRGLSGKVKFKW